MSDLFSRRVWTRDEIRGLLKRSGRAVARGLVAIHSLQTDDERAHRSTLHHNGVGFNSRDADFLSSLAEFYRDRGFLSPRQLTLGRRGILKYSGQLAMVANGELRV